MVSACSLSMFTDESLSYKTTANLLKEYIVAACSNIQQLIYEDRIKTNAYHRHLYSEYHRHLYSEYGYN